MKSGKKAIAGLIASNPDTRPRPIAYRGTGQWLRWHTPAGDCHLIGVAITLNGTTYRHIMHPDDSRAAELYGTPAARQLGKLLDATAAALASHQPLPATISSEAIPIVQGDNPGEILETLWQHISSGLLLKKKLPSYVAEQSIAEQSTREVAPEESENHTRAPAAQAAPGKTGAKHHKT